MTLHPAVIEGARQWLRKQVKPCGLLGHMRASGLRLPSMLLGLAPSRTAFPSFSDLGCATASCAVSWYREMSTAVARIRERKSRGNVPLATTSPAVWVLFLKQIEASDQCGVQGVAP
jgi:hypothetical protein